MTRISRLVCLAAALCVMPMTSAAEWGDISGSVVLDGTAPKPVLLHAKGAPVKDGAVCAAEDTYSDTFVVNQENNGIANVFVFLYKAPKSIHPDLEAVPTEKPVLDQKGCVFLPHAMVVRAGQSVEVINSDGAAHNTHTYPTRNQAVNILVGPNTPVGEGLEVATATRESLPHQVKCDFHPWMLCYWLVVDHPYAAVTDADGKFQIKGLPVGEHEFRVWHEKAGWLEKKFSVTVKAGENPELEPLKFGADKFDG